MLAIKKLRVSYDSRHINKGMYFVPFKGDSFDGHDFIEAALASGACGVIEEELYELAKRKLIEFGTKIVAVTGSAGKTTTKEIVGKILSTQFKVLKSPGNINTLIGLSATVVNKLKPEHEYFVAEMGMDRAGELLQTSKFITPDVLIYTIINEAHLEKLGSKEDIVNAKAEILQNMDHDSITVLNKDDETVLSLVGKVPGKTLFYSINQVDFDLTALKLKGTHNRRNVIGASVAAHAVGMSKSAIQKVYPLLRSVDGRGVITKGINGITLIDDTYNANPASVKESLKVLKDLKGNKKIVFLGDMRELGDFEKQAHKDILLFLINEIRPDLVFTIGGRFKEAKEELKLNSIENFENSEIAATKAEKLINLKSITNNDVVLIKGSRGIQTEKVLSKFHKPATLNKSNTSLPKS